MKCSGSISNTSILKGLETSEESNSIEKIVEESKSAEEVEVQQSKTLEESNSIENIIKELKSAEEVEVQQSKTLEESKSIESMAEEPKSEEEVEVQQSNTLEESNSIEKIKSIKKAGSSWETKLKAKSVSNWDAKSKEILNTSTESESPNNSKLVEKEKIQPEEKLYGTFDVFY